MSIPTPVAAPEIAEPSESLPKKEEKHELTVWQRRDQASEELEKRCLAIFPAIWASGDFIVVDRLENKYSQDSDGYLLPNQAKFAAGGKWKVAVLRPEEYPEECRLRRLIQDLDREIEAIKAGW